MLFIGQAENGGKIVYTIRQKSKEENHLIHWKTFLSKI